ncbi:MAG: S1 RNA-binding domain-containing protein [Candidatus Omnitrophota bacterium]
MQKQILINIESQEKRVAIVEGSSLEEFYVERAEHQRVVGNIYKGVVSAILPAMGAAFVSLGLKKDGFLHVSDVVDRPPDLEELLSEPLDHEAAEKRQNREVPHITKLLKKGQEIMVQVVKEPIGTKGARLTTHISLPGRYLVIMPYESHNRRFQAHSQARRTGQDQEGVVRDKDT